jgi:hypothetical protein
MIDWQKVAQDLERENARLKKTLAQQEPVAWYDEHGMITHDPFEGITPLYTAPKQLQWVGLTAKDLSEIPASCFEGAIWADAKLKEKNT